MRSSLSDISDDDIVKNKYETSAVQNGDSEVRTLEVYSSYRLHESPFRWFWKFSRFIDSFGEARGIQRQSPNERTKLDFWHYLHLSGIWIGATCTLPSMTGFFLGPLSFNLSFNASVSSGVLGCFVGSLVGAFGATMGPRSGLRTMIGVRYQFGWWFSKFIALLSCCTLLGWLIINATFGGQLLSALTNEYLSIRIGILIIFLVILVLSVFGIKWLSFVDTFFIIPLFVAFLLCFVCTGHQFEVKKHSLVSGEDLNTAWVSFFQSCIGITSTWLPIASDYHLDMPQKTNKIAVFFFVLAVMFLPTAFVGILGCGLASAALFNSDQKEIYDKNGGAGLIVNGMKRWNGGGKFLVVIMFISLITNGGLTAYSFGLSFQTLGRPLARFPRYIPVIFGTVIWYVLATVGESQWADVVSNFIPIIGYWSMIYAVILIIETLWFRRHSRDEYDWEEYLNPKHFPIMYAAMLAFGFGVAGVVIGMKQTYYVGRVAKVVGSGCELGTLLSVGFSIVSYIPLRYIEIRLRNNKKIQP